MCLNTVPGYTGVPVIYNKFWNATLSLGDRIFLNCSYLSVGDPLDSALVFTKTEVELNPEEMPTTWSKAGEVVKPYLVQVGW